MATKVQTKSYMPGSMMDLNNGLCNGMWNVHNDDRTSGSEKSQFYDSFLVRQTIDGYPGYAKEQTRQTILKQESIFRHQLQELHRLYRRQRDLMNELTMKEHYTFSMPAEASKSNTFLSHVPSRILKEMHGSMSSFPKVDLTFGRGSISEANSIFSPPNSLKGKHTLTEFRSLSSNHNTAPRTVIDLELPADVDEDNDGKQVIQTVHNLSTGKSCNLADLNEPIQVEEASSTASLCDKLQKQDFSTNSGLLYLSKIAQQDLKERDGKAKCYDNGFGNGVFSHHSNSLQAEPKKVLEHSRKRTIFGVELCERSHTPSFDSSQSSSWDHNASTLHHNRWLGSTDASRQIPDNFSGNRLVNNINSRLMTSSRAGVSYQNGVAVPSGMSSKISASSNLEELHEKVKVMDGQKNHENLEKKLPPWLMANSSFNGKHTDAKETKVYQMNLDSLQNHSQQFFKKAEITKGAHDPKVETDNSQGIMKILGVPIIDVPKNTKELVSYSHDPSGETKSFVKDDGKSNCRSDLRHHIDLNMSFEEEEAPSTPLIPDSVVKIATMEIDLEAPAALESETEDTPSKLPMNDDVLMDDHEELVKVAAEAIMVLSSSEQPPQPEADTLLRWFAELIASGDDAEKDSENLKGEEESIPEGMDEFEYLTLKLQETKEEYYCYKLMMIVEEKEEEEGLSRKRTARKGQGKRGRPRKDFQRDVLPGIVSLSRREVTEDLQTFEEAFTGIGVSWQSSLSKRKAAGKNGRGRRRLVALSPSSHTPPPPPPAAEQTVCREVALEEKSLSGWGKRTRRLPRQRCQNGNHQSLALKC